MCAALPGLDARPLVDSDSQSPRTRRVRVEASTIALGGRRAIPSGLDGPDDHGGLGEPPGAGTAKEPIAISARLSNWSLARMDTS